MSAAPSEPASIRSPSPGRDRWICLVYHEVPATPPAGTAGHFSITTTEFARQLDWLVYNGYRIESVENASRMGDSRVVALTFDDGHHTHYAEVYPQLAERRARATFFVITDRVGSEGYVTWDQLREMSEAGMSIQSHTASHPFLSTLTPDEVLAELRDSKARLDDGLSQNTTSLALPGGDPPRGRARKAIEHAGYRLVATSRVGTNRHEQNPRDPLRFVPRLTVRQAQTASHFERVIRQDRATLRREYLRANILGAARAFLGPRRYARWRKAVLNAIG